MANIKKPIKKEIKKVTVKKVETENDILVSETVEVKPTEFEKEVSKADQIMAQVDRLLDDNIRNIRNYVSRQEIQSIINSILK